MANSGCDGADWWTFEAVQEALVEAVGLWRRSPGSGASPFATDGPWQWMVREGAKGDYDARGGFDTSSDVPLRPLPLTRDEVAKRDAVSEWLGFVGAAQDRKLVVMATEYLARGRQRVPWRTIKHRMGIKFGEGGLKKRYDKSLFAIAAALNGAEISRW